MKGKSLVAFALFWGGEALLFFAPDTARVGWGLSMVVASVLLLLEIGIGLGSTGVLWLLCAGLGFWRGEDIAVWAAGVRPWVMVGAFVGMVVCANVALRKIYRADIDRIIRERHG